MVAVGVVGGSQLPNAPAVVPMLGAGGNNNRFAGGGDDLVENSDLTATTAGSAWSVHAGLLVPYLFPSPAVGSSADGRLEVLAVSEGGRLLHQWQLAVAGNLVGLVLPRPSLTDEGEEPPGARASGDSSKAVQPNELQRHARACHRNGRASLIKGHGAALLREKLVAAAAERFIVIAERAKLVDRLGEGSLLPVEVVGFG